MSMWTVHLMLYFSLASSVLETFNLFCLPMAKPLIIHQKLLIKNVVLISNSLTASFVLIYLVLATLYFTTVSLISSSSSLSEYINVTPTYQTLSCGVIFFLWQDWALMIGSLNHCLSSRPNLFASLSLIQMQAVNSNSWPILVEIKREYRNKWGVSFPFFFFAFVFY